ncbi:MAG TPA: XrtN system VIT domain-containing protein [Cyclobacteriaceae bacterium]|nr:XrtN system VIT domain-containing protein [Cyclobacteriaceae bacterium]
METTSSDSATGYVHKPVSDSITQSSLLPVGYGMLLVSLLIYALFAYSEDHNNFFMVFWIHYIMGILYTTLLIAGRAIGIRRSWQKENIDKTVLTINLFLISAYALNREIPVFENSTDWFCVYLLVSSFTLLSYRFFAKLPAWVNNVQYLFLGSAITLYIYLALYTFNYYAFGAIGILGFGLGAHILVPLFLVIACIYLFIHNYTGGKAYLWVGSGIALTIGILVAFIIEWNSRISKIETQANQSVMYGQTELPIWVTLAQNLKSDWITERILKSDLVYSTAGDFFGEWRFMPKIVSWDEVRKHDPLVYIASKFSKCTLSAEDKVKILKAISNGRHIANERLWNGDNLTTSYVVSDVDIYTDLRIAYTEQYLNVKNNSDKGGWQGNREEAIYTFYLPEGSVVTSLSLWIGDNEQKGILTSKQKATTAYKTIVGVEQRDPSVIHWQEGNTVTVRVFPCTTIEERKFKIGITSPLQEIDHKIVYKNIIFDGPSTDAAKETRRIRFIGSNKSLSPGNAFERDKNGDYVAEQQYDRDFELKFNAGPITPNQFSFDGYTYIISKKIINNQPATFNNIYLDINNSWTSGELNDLKSLIEKHSVYVYPEEEFIKLDNENWSAITSEMQKQNFSLFPFHHVKDLSQTLVVTKGKILSPHLSDISDSKFAEHVNKFFSESAKVKVFNLGDSSSTYINSFKELRGLEFAKGNTADLLKMISSKSFPKSEESEDRITIHDANLDITRIKYDSIAPVNNAPDHLARLFAYNNIMRKAGAHYFSHDFINDDLVDEAATAYVVSPVSSLIVLETQEDYKRFDIQDKENSLKNAAKKSSGAVPEPHEWALIILLVFFILYLKFKS